MQDVVRWQDGFFRDMPTPTRIVASSAGTHPSSNVNPVIVDIMREVGIELGSQKPKLFALDMKSNDTIVVNMGCMYNLACPALFVNNVIDWGIADPRGKNIDQIRMIRDQIYQKVSELIDEIDK